MGYLNSYYGASLTIHLAHCVNPAQRSAKADQSIDQHICHNINSGRMSFVTCIFSLTAPEMRKLFQVVANVSILSINHRTYRGLTYIFERDIYRYIYPTKKKGKKRKKKETHTVTFSRSVYFFKFQVI